MEWVYDLDVAVFHFVNGTIRNPVFDWVMPYISGNLFFFPALIALCFWLIWKDRVRGLLCVFMAVCIIWPGDSFICNTIKAKIERPRPYVVLLKATKTVKGWKYNSMPSSHAANWGAATMIVLIYYRRSWRFMVPIALLVSFSRVYNGVHYPSDVLVGLILGAGYAAAGVWTINRLWLWLGPKTFPKWQKEHLPSLVVPKIA